MTDWLDPVLAETLNPGTVAGGFVYALLFLTLALIGSRLIRLFARQSAAHFPDVTALYFIAQLLQVGVFLVTLILYAQLVPPLRALGTALLTGVSITSILIGLAAQNTLANLIAGLALVLYRPFQVGDQVQLMTPKGVETGILVSLTLGYTRLRNTANEQIIVPNSVMASVVIIQLPSAGRE